jgi:hypothetical protein
METTKKHMIVKILLALLPAIIFTQNYAWMTLNNKIGWAFLIIWALMIWSVWQFTEKNNILERFFRLTEISFFLLPISAIVFAFVLGSKAVSSTTNEASQAGAALGTAIGGTFVVVVSFIIGIIGGIIMHLIASKYDKKAELSEIKQSETVANKHGVIFSLVVFIILVVAFGTASSSTTKQDSINIKSGDKTVTETANSTASTDTAAQQPAQVTKVDLQITKKGFHKASLTGGDFQDQIQMDVTFTNKTDKNIKGVQGDLTFYDMFDNEIKTINIAYDKGILAGQSKVWNAGISYNQFIDEDTKLRDTDLKDLKYKWEVKTIVYEDNTKETF